ncbi:glycosyltransferase family 4 protein [Pseudoalteromonas piratica]|uniref:Glycosyl transferase family 1 domain-containing protein n=1 Tax=Pseudoalteromonas piratica TaxID=1348114 RepID=A0A0A7EDF0_9GAMM|nr:glycosyltransferase family 4 protein [Pseudoalteromonas piratica]AIY64604.1 hypothetical protein OM33_05155 [Pseudoalteromonas piratica]
MRIAVITPWPGDKSGIADYCWDLLHGLVDKGVYIDVFTQCESPTPSAKVKIHNGSVDEWELQSFDLRIFHIGNNYQYHGYMLNLLKKFGGIVHLHDYVVHNLVVDMAQMTKGWEWYFERLACFYGADTANMVRDNAQNGRYIWEGQEICDIPFNDDFVTLSDAVITHSKYAAKKITSKHKNVSVCTVHQVYNMLDQPVAEKHSHDTISFGVFGHVQPNKCIDQLIDSLNEIDTFGRRVEIRVAGEVGNKKYHNLLLEKLENIKGFTSLNILGYLSEEAFLAEIKSVDVVVALRDPSMGETSAIAMRALQLNKPLIVTDTCWYSELPDFVHKIKCGSDAVESLAQEISCYFTENNILNEKHDETRVYSEQVLNFTRVTDFIKHILFQIHHNTTIASEKEDVDMVIAKYLYDLELVDELNHKPLRTMIYTKLAPFLSEIKGPENL